MSHVQKNTITPHKMGQSFDTTACLKEISEIHFKGNITPHAWYAHVLTEQGKPYLIAIMLLSEIVYKYRLIEEYSPETHDFKGLRKQFKGDKLQYTSKKFADKFGLSKLQVSTALARLEQLGLIIREFRTVDTPFGRLPNIQFLAPVSGKIAEISQLTGDILPDEENDEEAFEYTVVSSSHKPTGFKEKDRVRQVYQSGVSRKNEGGSHEKKGYRPHPKEVTLQRDLRAKEKAAAEYPSTEEEAAAAFQTIKNLIPLPNSDANVNQAALTANDRIIQSELTHNQKKHIQDRVNQLPQAIQQSFSEDLADDIGADVLNPKTFTHSGNDFQRKLNTLISQIKKGSWSPVVKQQAQIEEKNQVARERMKKITQWRYDYLQHSGEYQSLVQLIHFSSSESARQQLRLKQQKAKDAMNEVAQQLLENDPDFKIKAHVSVLNHG